MNSSMIESLSLKTCKKVSDALQDAEKEELIEYMLSSIKTGYILVLDEKNQYLFEYLEFHFYFDMNDTQCWVNRNKHICAQGECDCRRWDSYICNHMINEARSFYSSGAFTVAMIVKGIYNLKGSIWG